jgi:hypothetical protein
MQRRSFFKWLFSSAIPFVIPSWARAQSTSASAVQAAPDETVWFRELAAVVLPASLGQSGTDAAADAFAKWIRDYKPNADTDHGYGHTRIQGLPPNPAAHYAEQFRRLDAAAAAKGAPFARLDRATQRAIVEAALAQDGVTRIPQRPNGQHVAADLMSYYFHSSDGQDFLYAAAIRVDDCRGLPNSGDRPAPWKG